MGKGLDAIEQQAAEQAARRDAGTKEWLPELKVYNADHARGPFQVRFLEQGQDITWYPFHEFKIPDSSRQGGNKIERIVCPKDKGAHLECAACSAGMQVKKRIVINLIQRQRAVFQKGTDGKIIKPYITVGYEDQVVIANLPGTTSDLIRQADGQYHGLMSRDFVITYSNNTFQSWNMSPALDGAGNAMAVAMSEADFALAAKKPNLDDHFAAPEPQEIMRLVRDYGANSGARQGQQSHLAGAPQQYAQGGQVAAPVQNQFLAGAQAAPAPVGSAFGAAQQAAPPAPQHPPAVVPVIQPAPQQVVPPVAPAAPVQPVAVPQQPVQPQVAPQAQPPVQ